MKLRITLLSLGVAGLATSLLTIGSGKTVEVKADSFTAPVIHSEFTLEKIPHSNECVWMNDGTCYATMNEAENQQWSSLFVTVQGIEEEIFVPQAVADWYKAFPKELKFSDYAKNDSLYQLIQQYVPSNSGVKPGQSKKSQFLSEIVIG